MLQFSDKQLFQGSLHHKQCTYLYDSNFKYILTYRSTSTNLLAVKQLFVQVLPYPVSLKSFSWAITQALGPWGWGFLSGPWEPWAGLNKK